MLGTRVAVLAVVLISPLFLGEKAFIGVDPEAEAPVLRIEPGESGGAIYILINRTQDAYTFTSINGSYPYYRIQELDSGRWIEVDDGETYYFCLSGSLRPKTIGSGMTFPIVGWARKGKTQRIGLELVSDRGDTLWAWSEPVSIPSTK